MLEFQGGQIGPIGDEYLSLPGKRVEVEESAFAGFCYGWSFVNVLRSTVGGLKRLSSFLLDVFPVSECFKAELGGVEQRSTVDCYMMEPEQMLSKELLVLPSPASLSLAAADSLKMNDWVKLQLGFFGLFGLSAGLELKPKGSQNRAVLLGHAGPVLGPVLGVGFGSWFGSYSGSGFGSCFRSGFFLRF